MMGPSNDFVNFNRSIKDQIAALSAQITKSFSKPTDSINNSNNCNRPYPYSRNNNLGIIIIIVVLIKERVLDAKKLVTRIWSVRK